MFVLIQSGSNVWPQDANGAMIFDEQVSISDTWEVRIAHVFWVFFTGFA